jgi:hypothetical protein
MSSTCHSCGNVAPDLLVCSACREEAYCNRDCQLADWKDHEALCLVRQKEELIMDLCKREVAWLQSLPPDITETLKKTEALGNHAFLYQHHVTFIQFALVLAGVNACHYHDMMESSGWKAYTQEFNVHVLQPWFSQHATFLTKEGFRLDTIQQGAAPQALIRFCACAALPVRMPLGTRVSCHHCFQLQPGCPLFWNQKHRNAALVEEIMLRPGQPSHAVESGEEADTNRTFHVLRTLGITAGRESLKDFYRGSVPVSYMIRHPERIFQDTDVSWSTWLIRATQGTTGAREAGAYFAECQTALLPVGITISLKVYRDFVSSRGNFTDEGWAQLVVTAAAGDAATAMAMYENFDLKVRHSRGTVASIGRLIQEYSAAYEA